jgi:UrcA family protein
VTKHSAISQNDSTNSLLFRTEYEGYLDGRIQKGIATMKKPLMIMTGSALATAALFFASAPARSAEISSGAEVVRVTTADLDLSSEAGRKALDRRIGRAVAELCGQASDADLVGLNAVRKCRDDALVQAHRARDQRLALRSAEPIQLALR